jgi:hypothetical protein
MNEYKFKQDFAKIMDQLVSENKSFELVPRVESIHYAAAISFALIHNLFNNRLHSDHKTTLDNLAGEEVPDYVVSSTNLMRYLYLKKTGGKIPEFTGENYVLAALIAQITPNVLLLTSQ